MSSFKPNQVILKRAENVTKLHFAYIPSQKNLIKAYEKCKNKINVDIVLVKLITSGHGIGHVGERCPTGRHQIRWLEATLV